MKRKRTTLVLTMLLLGMTFNPIFGQDDATTTMDTIAIDQAETLDSTDVISERQALIVDTVVIVPKLDFANIRLFDALTALARAYNLSLFIDSSVTGNIALRLDNILLNDALHFIIKEHDLAWERTGDIIKIFRPTPPPPIPEPLNIQFENDLLSIDLENADLERLIDTLIDLTGRNIILEGGRSKVALLASSERWRSKKPSRCCSRPTGSVTAKSIRLSMWAVKPETNRVEPAPAICT